MHFIIRKLHDIKFANSSVLFVNKHFKIIDANNDDIENAIGEKIPVADYAKHDKLNVSWQLPIGCDEG